MIMKSLFFLFLVSTPLILFSQKENILNVGTKENNNRYNRCSHLTLKQQGDTIATAFCAKYRSKEYSFQTTYVNNKPFALRIYKNNGIDEIQVSEFWFLDNKWERVDYHCKSVSYSDRLLKVYLKKKKFIHYNQIWHRGNDE